MGEHNHKKSQSRRAPDTFSRARRKLTECGTAPAPTARGQHVTENGNRGNYCRRYFRLLYSLHSIFRCLMSLFGQLYFRKLSEETNTDFVIEIWDGCCPYSVNGILWRYLKKILPISSFKLVMADVPIPSIVCYKNIWRRCYELLYSYSLFADVPISPNLFYQTIWCLVKL